MKNPRAFVLAISALALATAATPHTQEPSAPLTDLVQTAAKTDDLKTFSSLVAKAGLTDTLKQPGPYTVFAPTDAAFEKIPKDLLDKLADDPAALKKILSYHVVSGATGSADLKDGAQLKTVGDETLKVSVTPSQPAADNAPAAPPVVTINEKRATVVKPDVKATNGVIHEIDNVLIPPSVAPTPPSPS